MLFPLDYNAYLWQLLDELLDNGFPLATESNVLKELIKPPNILRTIANTVTGKTKWVYNNNYICLLFIPLKETIVLTLG